MSWRPRFFIALALVASTITLVGWLSDLRVLLHDLLIAFLVAAFWPMVFLLPIIALFGLGLLAALAKIELPLDGAEPLVELSARSTAYGYRRYVQALRSIRHPIFWGAIAGAATSVLALWLLVAVLIVPKETRTVALLAQAGARIESRFSALRGFPGAESITDGFSRPVRYATSGHSVLARYHLRSAGYDGAMGTADDLCLSGDNPIARRGLAAIDAFLARHASKASIKIVLSDLRSLRDCAGVP